MLSLGFAERSDKRNTGAEHKKNTGEHPSVRQIQRSHPLRGEAGKNAAKKACRNKKDRLYLRLRIFYIYFFTLGFTGDSHEKHLLIISSYMRRCPIKRTVPAAAHYERNGLVMELYGYKLSDCAASFLAKYEKELDKELHLSKLPDPYPLWSALHVAAEYYVIGIKPGMPDTAFEAALCHELYHAWQFSHGFPTVVSNDKNKEDVNTYTERLNSHILDLSADDAVREYGLDDSFFMKQRYKRIKNMSIANFAASSDSFGRDLLAIDLIIDCHGITANQKALILQNLESALPDVYNQYGIYQKRIDRYGYKTPEGCYQILGFIVNSVELWPHCHIVYAGERIHTLEHFRTFCP